MTTSQQSVKIRRAKGTDVVNLYRLLVAEQEQRPFVSVDETLALGYVLTVIEKGLAMVAEHSGRLVGSIGFDIYRPQFSTETSLDSVWFTVVPAYKQTSTGLALLKRALAVIDEYGIKVRLDPCSLQHDERSSRWLQSNGFEAYTTLWLRQNNKVETNAEHPQRITDGDISPSFSNP